MNWEPSETPVSCAKNLISLWGLMSEYLDLWRWRLSSGLLHWLMLQKCLLPPSWWVCMSANFCETTTHNILADNHLHSCCSENLKSHIFKFSSFSTFILYSVCHKLNPWSVSFNKLWYTHDFVDVCSYGHFTDEPPNAPSVSFLCYEEYDYEQSTHVLLQDEWNSDVNTIIWTCRILSPSQDTVFVYRKKWLIISAGYIAIAIKTSAVFVGLLSFLLVWMLLYFIHINGLLRDDCERVIRLALSWLSNGKWMKEKYLIGVIKVDWFYPSF